MSRLVFGKGPERAKIMFVGEAPGKDEVAKGEPFVGSAGQLLRKAMMAVGINPDDCYFTNICFVQPPGNKLHEFFDPKTGIPNDDVLDAMEALQNDIRRIKPNVIVPLGAFPLWALANKHEGRQTVRWTKAVRDNKPIMTYVGIGNWRGSILECTLAQGFKCIPTYHPSYINQEGYAEHGTFLADLSRIAREAAFPEIRRPQKTLYVDPRGSARFDVEERLRVAPGYDSRVIDLVVADNIHTLDIEYTVGTKGSNLYCIGLTNSPEWAAAISIKNQSDLEYVRRLLSLGLPINAQNSMFDLSVLAWHYQIDLFDRLVYDTMLASHAISIESSKGLDYLDSIYTDQPYYKDMVDWDAIKKGKQDPSVIPAYNCIDEWTQHEVMEKQIFQDFLDPHNVKSGLAKWRVFQFEMMLQTPLWEMSRRGVRVHHGKDLEKGDPRRKGSLTELTETLHYEADGLIQLLREVSGKKDFNPKSSQMTGWLLHEVLKLPVIATTPTPHKKTGKPVPSTNDKVLAALVNKCTNDLQREVLSLVRDARKRLDLLSKFAEVEFDLDGRARGMYSPAGTDTGRLSSKKFYPTGLGLQQQNIPTDKRARAVFVPDPEMLFVYADLERAESLVVAKITNDPEMLRVHAPGIDAHKELASRLFNKPIDEITDDERYLGKRTRHAGNYMQGGPTFMAGVNQASAKTGVSITLAEAKRFIQIYRDVHPFLTVWWRDTEAELWRTRKLYNLLGREREFFGHIRAIVPAAVAYVPQSTVGDTLNVALLNLEGIGCAYMKDLGLWDQYKEWSLELKDCGYQSLLQVHDAVGFQVRERDADRALPLVSRLMTIPLTVPATLETFAIPVEILVGSSWGTTKKWTEPRVENGKETNSRLATGL